MLILVCYDVSTESSAGKRRLRRVAKTCEAYGLRVQNSVFECHLDSTQLRKLKHDLRLLIDVSKDSLRLYNLGENYSRKITHIGTKSIPDITDILIV